MSKKKNILTRKVNSRVTPETYRMLDEIKEQYGFRSVYEIVQALIHCFLRAAYPEKDTQIEPLPYDIEQMFAAMSDAEKHVEFGNPPKRSSHKPSDE